jgi:hypothetical protein
MSDIVTESGIEEFELQLSVKTLIMLGFRGTYFMCGMRKAHLLHPSFFNQYI